MKPITAWAIVGPDGDIKLYTISGLKDNAVETFDSVGVDTWTNWRKLGYRAVRVRIEEIKEGE